MWFGTHNWLKNVLPRACLEFPGNSVCTNISVSLCVCVCEGGSVCYTRKSVCVCFPGVHSGLVALLSEKADVQYSPEAVCPDRIVTEISSLGFGAELISESDLYQEGQLDLLVSLSLRHSIAFTHPLPPSLPHFFTHSLTKSLNHSITPSLTHHLTRYQG